jgi:hypothetical protein
MTDLSAARPDGRRASPPLVSTMALPALDLLRPSPNLVAEVARRSRVQTSVPAALPGEAVFVLWVILLANSGLLSWLVAVHLGAASCSGFACAVVTFGRHESLLLAATAASVLALVGSALFARGLTRANAPQLAVIAVAAVVGACALLGLIALLIMVVVGAALALLVVAAVAAILTR